MKTGMTNLQQRKEIAVQQAKLGEEMQARKELESAVTKIESRSHRIYALEKEQELIAAVRKGDRDTSYRLLNELLADIIQKYPDDPREVKARLLELIVVLSRAAIEGGANLKMLLSLNSQYLEELNKIESVEDQCLWILKVTQKFVDCVGDSGDIKNLQVIQKAAEYMRDNFNKKLTIDDISQAVYLSPCYLSKIFKQELGCTIMEFLTKVRIDEAKKLLRNPRYNIMQVANLIGFDDPSYFTKVFKKSEGITPSQYKRRAL
jgi:two-component system response regulator YesN